jgi:hypothetical protein
MDTKALVKKLREVFIENNKGDRKFSLVWLSRLTYGGLYYSKKFALHVKTEHKIERLLPEISYVSSLIREKAHEEAGIILRYSVHGPEEEIEFDSEDYLVFEKEPELA